MKIVAVIPARYDSRRLPGKPLADIAGKPMVWWVYRQVEKVKGIDAVYVATDSEKVSAVCQNENIPCILTPPCPTSTERVYEVSLQIEADFYLCVNGDEPLIDPKVVEQILPKSPDHFFAANLMTKISDPVEAIDSSNIKVAVGPDNEAIYFSRSPIPHPKSTIAYSFYKHLGVLCYSPKALSFFAHTSKGPLETIEDINELRFIEHKKPLQMILVEAKTLSVDTQRDLDDVRRRIESLSKEGEKRK